VRRRISIIGGGPAGLMSARLIARDHPDWDITVYERLDPTETFGFGVGLTRGLMTGLRAVARDLHDDLAAACAGFSSAAFRLPAGEVRLPSYHAGAISRSLLLAILLDHARRDTVRVEIGHAADCGRLSAESDLVIGADGLSSTTREQRREAFGVSEEVGRGWFIWCGAELRLDGTVFMPVHTEDGTFVAHAYPYAEGRSTFVIETDADTLERAGCRTERFAADADSDQAALEYLSEAFSGLLQGARLVGNRSRWMHFRTVRCARWSDGNVVLLGDAAATAHPSLGSGTKLALEGAIALARALAPVGEEPPVARLAAFERGLRPSVQRLQARARRSQLWWESFPSRLDLPGPQLAFAYMSRAGAVSLSDLERVAPDLAGAAVAGFAGVGPGEVPADNLREWVLARPLIDNGRTLSRRMVEPSGELGAPCVRVNTDDPWGEAADGMLGRLATDGLAQTGTVVLTGEATREALLDRLALGERIRAELGAKVAVACSEPLLDDAVDGLVAGRADLVRVER
jgi:anthraniloyl-CoA monooxygenase